MQKLPYVIGSALLLASCGHKATDSAAQSPIPVEVVAVASAGGAQQNSIPATFARDRESTLSFRLGGVIAAFPAKIGESLPRGALVAAISGEPYRAAYERGNADVARLSRSAQRNAALLAAGAIAAADKQDTDSALQAARAATNAAHYDLESTRLRMPFTGVVLSKTMEIGTTAAAGQPVVTVADLHAPLIARAQVAVSAVAALHHGSAAEIKIGDNGITISGHILRIGAAADARSGTVEVDLALDGQSNIPSGAVGSVRFSSSSQPGASTEQAIPAEALVDAHQGVGHVFVVDQHAKVAHLLKVRVFGFDGDNVMVSGLSPDAKVITTGGGFVSDGQRVAVQAR